LFIQREFDLTKHEFFFPACLVSNGSGRPTDNVFLSCPCRHPLSCVGGGVFDIPLGELGTWVFWPN